MKLVAEENRPASVSCFRGLDQLSVVMRLISTTRNISSARNAEALTFISADPIRDENFCPLSAPKKVSSSFIIQRS